MAPPPSDPPADRSSSFRRALRVALTPLRWLGQHELATLVALLAGASALWAFLELADQVVAGETKEIDQRILLLLRTDGDPSDPLGPRWVEELGRDLTAYGGVGGLTLITFAVAGLLFLQDRRRAALLVLIAVGTGLLVSLLLKRGFDRPRPDLVPHGSHVYTTSFPSGHSMNAAVTYFTLGALLAQALRRFTLKAYVLLLATLLTALVGVSRVYLGVHWPSDVLAGWTAGLAWALLVWITGRALDVRRAQASPGSQEEEEEPP